MANRPRVATRTVSLRPHASHPGRSGEGISW